MRGRIRRWMAVLLAVFMLIGGTITSQAVYFDTGTYTNVLAGNVYHNGAPGQQELNDVVSYYNNCIPASVRNFMVNKGIKVYVRGDEFRNDALAIAYAPVVYAYSNGKISKIGENGYVVYFANNTKNYSATSVIHEIGHQIDYYAAISTGYYRNNGYGISGSQEWQDLYFTYYKEMYKIDNLTRANVCRNSAEAWAEMFRVIYVDPDAIIRISPALYNFIVAQISAVVGADATPVQKAVQSVSIDTFDYVAYADTYPDLKAAFGYDRQALFNHYIQYGMLEGRKASFNGASTPAATYTTVETQAGFDHVFYADSYPDVKAAFGYDKDLLWKHYQEYGKAEGRTARFTEVVGNTTGTYNNFDYVFYADANPDVKAAFGYNKKNLWNHYQKYGKKEGRAVNFF